MIFTAGRYTSLYFLFISYCVFLFSLLLLLSHSLQFYLFLYSHFSVLLCIQFNIISFYLLFSLSSQAIAHSSPIFKMFSEQWIKWICSITNTVYLIIFDCLQQIDTIFLLFLFPFNFLFFFFLDMFLFPIHEIGSTVTNSMDG